MFEMTNHFQLQFDSMLGHLGFENLSVETIFSTCTVSQPGENSQGSDRLFFPQFSDLFIRCAVCSRNTNWEFLHPSEASEHILKQGAHRMVKPATFSGESPGGRQCNLRRERLAHGHSGKEVATNGFKLFS